MSLAASGPAAAPHSRYSNPNGYSAAQQMSDVVPQSAQRNLARAARARAASLARRGFRLRPGEPASRNVLFLGAYDWANVCNRVARAMNVHARRTTARVATVHPHPFGYEEDIIIERDGMEAVRSWAATADWVVASGDGDYEALFGLLAELRLPATCRLAALHVGSAYRARPAHYNVIDRDRFAQRFFTTDLYRLSSEGDVQAPAVAIFAPADVVVAAVPPVRGGPTIAHSPSNRTTKGTAEILPVIEDVVSRHPGVELELIEGVPYAECARRRALCPIMVDQLHPVIRSFGAAAVEALAAGSAVLADYWHITPDVYAFFERPPIVQVDNVDALRARLDQLVENPQRLAELRRASLAWAQRNTAPAGLARFWLRQLQ
jgi:hypothetical protein